MNKPIILIGGTAGTGKTTLARDLSALLSIDHRLGTGFIREIVKSQTTFQADPDLFQYTFESTKPWEITRSQARRIFDAAKSCIDRARREGTSLIIEGNHLLPSLYSGLNIDAYFVLSMPQEEEHFRRLNGLTHFKRNVSVTNLVNIREIGKHLEGEAKEYGVICSSPYANLSYYERLINGKR